ncbi:MAG: C10 family peptidase [Muribaculaceae bacterium]|nr:C10 family peptidase [Muribaculaceae bacterium]
MKKFLLLLTAAVAAMSLWAAPVDQAAAMQKAKSFLANNLYAGRIMAPAALNPVLLKAEVGNPKLNQPVYYIYNTSTTFLVVAGDDRAEEILMVGDRPLRDINDLPLGLQDMLGQYKQEITFLQENPDVKVNPIVSPKNTPSLRATTVGPFLTCNWDQEAPYYNQCKFTYNATSYQCLTGCPATSASMVLYFWKYPTGPTGTVPSYTDYLDISSSAYSTNYKTFTYSSLPSTTFDWDNMLDNYTSGSYTTEQGNAVATLMRYVGQAEKMTYGRSGSGISVDAAQNVVDMFVRFGYDSNTTRLVKQYQSMDNSGNQSGQIYTDAQWASMLQEEMLAGRPIVFMAVSTSAGGHAFNVDGYRDSDNKYHCNFGWSGDGNAWCALNSFGYSSGWTSYNFNVYQQMVIGIQPPSGQVTTPELTVNPTSLSFTGSQVGQTYTKTFTVTGTDLTGNVTISSSNSVYTVSPATLTAAQAQAGATVTVTYKPTTAGTQTANITVASSGAESKTVTVSGTATTVPTINVNPATVNMNTTVGTPVTATFTVTGANLTNAVYLTCNGQFFSIDKTNITKNAANSGVTVTVTYNPTTYGNHTGTVTLTSSGAQNATVTLKGTANIVASAPVMLPAVEQYIDQTKFRADWTDETPAANVTSYTLEVTPKVVVPELIGSLVGTDFTGSSTGYYDITLPAPWGGQNVRGGLNSIIYFRNNYNNDGSYGNITFTVPEGYSNATFTMKITTANSNDGAGNLAVSTPQTASVNHNFTKNTTYSWLVTASAGEKITITTTDANYSPDISRIEVYTGDASTALLKAFETGDENSRTVTGITDKFYTVENLAAEGTFLYRVKALYIDGTESAWSNVEEVTLFENTPAYQPGDVNHDGFVNITDVNLLINYILNDGGDIFLDTADYNGDTEVTITDAMDMITFILNNR